MPRALLFAHSCFSSLSWDRIRLEVPMVYRFIAKLLCFSLAISLLSIVNAVSQDKPLKKFRWGVTSLSASQWIPWIAKEAKLYEKHGMDAELVLLRGSGQSAQAIIGNSILG